MQTFWRASRCIEQTLKKPLVSTEVKLHSPVPPQTEETDCKKSPSCTYHSYRCVQSKLRPMNAHRVPPWFSPQTVDFLLFFFFFITNLQMFHEIIISGFQIIPISTAQSCVWRPVKKFLNDLSQHRVTEMLFCEIKQVKIHPSRISFKCYRWYWSRLQKILHSDKEIIAFLHIPHLWGVDMHCFTQCPELTWRREATRVRSEPWLQLFYQLQRAKVFVYRCFCPSQRENWAEISKSGFGFLTHNVLAGTYLSWYCCTWVPTQDLSEIP